jgi:DNA polymerase-4
VRRTLLELAEKVAQRLRVDGYMAAKVTLKYRDADFVTCTRTQALAEATAVAIDLYRVASQLLYHVPNTKRKVRLLGLAASQLTAVEQQLSLFSAASQKRLQAERAGDAIKARFGPQAITRAALLDPVPSLAPDSLNHE